MELPQGVGFALEEIPDQSLHVGHERVVQVAAEEVHVAAVVRPIPSTPAKRKGGVTKRKSERDINWRYAELLMVLVLFGWVKAVC